MSRGLARELRSLVGEAPASVHVGVVTAIEAHDAWGHVLTVELQPEGTTVLARPGHPGTGSAGGGVYIPFELDAEVLVLLPAGDPNRAVALHGPASSAQPIPSGWNNDRVLVQHSAGLEVRGSDVGVVQAVVTEDLLGQLSGVLTEIAAIGVASAVLTPNTTALLATIGTGYRSAKFSTE